MAIKKIMLLLFIACPLYSSERKSTCRKRKDGLHLYTYSSADVGTYGATEKARRDRGVLQKTKKIKKTEQDRVQNTDTTSTLTPENTNTLPLPFSPVQLSGIINMLFNKTTTTAAANTDYIENEPEETSQIIDYSQKPIQKTAITFLLNNPDDTYQSSSEFAPSGQSTKLQ